MRYAFIDPSSCHAVRVQNGTPSAFRSLTPRLPGACLACRKDRQALQAKGSKKRIDRTRKRVTAIRAILPSGKSGVTVRRVSWRNPVRSWAPTNSDGMTEPLCPGCRERDARIAALERRVAEPEALVGDLLARLGQNASTSSL